MQWYTWWTVSILPFCWVWKYTCMETCTHTRTWIVRDMYMYTYINWEQWLNWLAAVKCWLHFLCVLRAPLFLTLSVITRLCCLLTLYFVILFISLTEVLICWCYISFESRAIQTMHILTWYYPLRVDVWNWFRIMLHVPSWVLLITSFWLMLFVWCIYRVFWTRSSFGNKFKWLHLWPCPLWFYSRIQLLFLCLVGLNLWHAWLGKELQFLFVCFFQNFMQAFPFFLGH